MKEVIYFSQQNFVDHKTLNIMHKEAKILKENLEKGAKNISPDEIQEIYILKYSSESNSANKTI